MTDKQTRTGKVTWYHSGEKDVLPGNGFVHLGPLFPSTPKKDEQRSETQQAPTEEQPSDSDGG